MNQQDRFYQVQKNTEKEEDRQKFKKVKYKVDCMIKSSHNSYLESLVGIIDDSDPIEISCPTTKKLFFSYLKTVDRTVRVVHLLRIWAGMYRQ